MAQTKGKRAAATRRHYSEEFKREAVQMLFDGHSAGSVAQRLGLSGPNVLYRWKQAAVDRAGPAARTIGDRVAQLEDELRRVERERDILKKTTARFGARCGRHDCGLIWVVFPEGFPLAWFA